MTLNFNRTKIDKESRKGNLAQRGGGKGGSLMQSELVKGKGVKFSSGALEYSKIGLKKRGQKRNRGVLGGRESALFAVALGGGDPEPEENLRLERIQRRCPDARPHARNPQGASRDD